MPLVDPIVFTHPELLEQLLQGAGFPRRRNGSKSSFPTLSGHPRSTPAVLPGKPLLTSTHISSVQRGAFFVPSIETASLEGCRDMSSFIDRNFRGNSKVVLPDPDDVQTVVGEVDVADAPAALQRQY